MTKRTGLTTPRPDPKTLTLPYELVERVNNLLSWTESLLSQGEDNCGMEAEHLILHQYFRIQIHEAAVALNSAVTLAVLDNVIPMPHDPS